MSAKETTLWLARDKDGSLSLYTAKPKRAEESGYFVAEARWEYYIPREFYPSITWENSPKEITIK